jgi:aspartyl-tRNA(Asn)/glutamyl-tRNA(Gln) amidotransferase subunit C
MVSKEEVKRLAVLARLQMPAEQEEKMAQDLGGILDHFKELAALNTEKVEAVSGGTDLANILREDEVTGEFNPSSAVKLFPKEKDGYNSVPPVFN